MPKTKANLTAHVNVRLPQDVLDRMPEKKRSAWVRDVITAAVEGRPLPTAEELDELRKLRADVLKVGVNLNQVARALNASADGSSAPPNTRAIEAAAGETADLLKQIDDVLSPWARGR